MGASLLASLGEVGSANVTVSTAPIASTRTDSICKILFRVANPKRRSCACSNCASMVFVSDQSTGSEVSDPGIFKLRILLTVIESGMTPCINKV
jgi:hypothetical protein